MSMIRRSRVGPLWIAIAMLGGAAIAGCGTTSHPNRTSTNATSGRLRLSVLPVHARERRPELPGPRSGRLPARSGINLQSPAGQSAMNACKKYLPSSGNPPPVPASVRHQELLLANCMRANGVPNFPDPDANGNIQFPVASPIPQSPAFQRAQNGPCKKYLSR